MKYLDCFRVLARHRTEEIVVTSAGTAGMSAGDGSSLQFQTQFQTMVFAGFSSD